jgi:hypothetical protein
MEKDGSGRKLLQSYELQPFCGFNLSRLTNLQRKKILEFHAVAFVKLRDGWGLHHSRDPRVTLLQAHAVQLDSVAEGVCGFAVTAVAS